MKHVLIAAAACLLLGERLAAQSDTIAKSHVAMHASHSALNMPPTRTGSGTSWIPDSSPMRMIGRNVGAWSLLFHGAAFPNYNRQNTKRGSTETGMTDWEMLMAVRNVGRGRLQLRAMTSLEPLVLGGEGYPLLLQTGGSYRHAYVHDRQHPHSAIVELGAFIEQRIAGSLNASLYTAAVGEPAVGPPAFMHRPSAQNDPFAPIGHHWQDISHQTSGVVTFGVNTQRFKLEGSAYNARAKDEHHLLMDFRDAKLDSYAGRITFVPKTNVVLSSWWSYVNAHNRLDPAMQMHRYGASALLDVAAVSGGRWTTSAVWGMNLHHHSGSSHLLHHGGENVSPHQHMASILAETNFELGTRTAVFARAERVKKSAEDLGFLGGNLMELFDLRTVVLGGIREVYALGAAEFSVGVRGAVNFVPENLRATYGNRTPTGFAAYARVRPRRQRM